MHKNAGRCAVPGRKQRKKIRPFAISFRRWKLFAFDIVCFIFVSALLLVADRIFGDLSVAVADYALFCAILCGTVTLARMLFRVYGNVWRYASFDEYLFASLADVVGGIGGALLCLLFQRHFTLWHCVAIVASFSVGAQVARFCYQHLYRITIKDKNVSKIGVAIVGAGEVGVTLAEELMYSHKSHYIPLCFVERDEQKIGSRLQGLRVYEENEKVFEHFDRLGVKEIFVAINELSNEDVKTIIDFYEPSGRKIKMYDFPFKDNLTQQPTKRAMREVSIEDLLFRRPMKFDKAAFSTYYADKTVLVTGGGGSIGSELSRQVAKLGPKKLIIVDIYENNAYEIEQELRREYGAGLDLTVEIASVRDSKRMESLFETHRPQIVFHAAAHKHVPLMEHSACEAIKNNVFGTKKTADMAEKYGAEKFILISTDKAVNPTNVMGASKRMCEMVVQCRTDSATSFAAVRFGNVLGSNGSVIPLFRKQIEAGGPLTITDKRIIRYFMTIPEAAQLVMEAGAMAESGQLFVLDMGKPVKILDLAENMIRLSGYTPYEDIDIKEIGLRPGEKLYEELLMKTEDLTATSSDRIFVETDKPFSRQEIDRRLALLWEASLAMQEGAGLTL
ncbi:MAG: polysaccharide biosynthesis protein [Clostridia bacterium]|nr:polysaccharide biosynthesis protein [Clostridia bacterium]